MANNNDHIKITNTTPRAGFVRLCSHLQSAIDAFEILNVHAHVSRIAQPTTQSRRAGHGYNGRAQGGEHE